MRFFLLITILISGSASTVSAQGPDSTFTLAGYDVKMAGEMGSFVLYVTTAEVEPGVEVATLRLRSETASRPPQLSFTWSLPSHDVTGIWTTGARFDKAVGPDWGPSRVQSVLAREAPVFTLFGSDDGNRLTVSVSDALNAVTLKAGIKEENARVNAGIDLFTERHRDVQDLELEIRFDTRPVPYYLSLAEVAQWWAEHPGYEPANVPDIARLPMYSTWYSYHQNVEATALLREVEIAKSMGYEAIIVDDGWQTLDSQRGYAFTGDWKPERIPRMKEFVDSVHKQGMDVLLWYAMSLVGERSGVFEKFQGKYLRYWDGQGAWVLDPRYPEVREHIIETYRTAMREWGVDGFKLDFLGFFVATDSTVLEATDGRDYASVNDATDRLMSDVMSELRKLNPDVMIEFRQRYIGPLMRKYGNMFRAGDSPNAAVDNRVRTVDLRLLSGNTAVHSDMFMWHKKESVEVAALQLLNILFAVPQLSVKLEDIPTVQREMITFYTDYWRKNRSVLLDGAFVARNPLANYPLIYASTSDKTIFGLYADMVIALDPVNAAGTIDVINAKPGGRVIFDVQTDLGRYSYRITNVQGQLIDSGSATLDSGPVAFDVPASGMLSLIK